MKIFLDTADIARIKQWIPSGLIDGITTNPTHLSKAGGNPTQEILKICSLLPEGDISVEITEQHPEAAYLQAKKIAHLAPNITVKIPCHRHYYDTIKRLVDENININITLVFSTPQALLMSKFGVRYISPFIGRLDDIGSDGIALLYALRDMVDQYKFETKILAASIRHVQHFQDAIKAGADIITLPPEILEKAAEHPLTIQGMQTFLMDWNKLGMASFP